MISEGSCDTEDWSNDAENTAFITLHFTIYNNRKLWFAIVIIFHSSTVYNIFDPINAIESKQFHSSAPQCILRGFGHTSSF